MTRDRDDARKFFAQERDRRRKERQRAPGPPRFEKPWLSLFTTTLWEYPSQHYNSPRGVHVQGDPNYVGATPSWVIWQLLQRYTEPGELVIDPMCGSGTTIDVAQDLDRRAQGFDLVPRRPDITQADARELPVDDAVADFVFIDPPYSTHINYSADPACIGKLDAGTPARGPEGQIGEAYYQAMEEVIAEIHRILKPGRFMGLYVSDSFRKGKKGEDDLFMPIGFELFSIMRDYFTPIDIVAVVRHNAKLGRENFNRAAADQGFLMRGFNYLFIMRRAPIRASRSVKD